MSALGFVPQRLISAREQLGMSRVQFAASVGKNPRTIENWEKGVTTPKIDDVFRIEQMCANRDVGEPIYIPPPRQQRLF